MKFPFSIVHCRVFLHSYIAINFNEFAGVKLQRYVSDGLSFYEKKLPQADKGNLYCRGFLSAWKGAWNKKTENAFREKVYSGSTFSADASLLLIPSFYFTHVKLLKFTFVYLVYSTLVKPLKFTPADER